MNPGIRTVVQEEEKADRLFETQGCSDLEIQADVRFDGHVPLASLPHTPLPLAPEK